MWCKIHQFAQNYNKALLSKFLNKQNARGGINTQSTIHTDVKLFLHQTLIPSSSVWEKTSKQQTFNEGWRAEMWSMCLNAQESQHSIIGKASLRHHLTNKPHVFSLRDNMTTIVYTDLTDGRRTAAEQRQWCFQVMSNWIYRSHWIPWNGICRFRGGCNLQKGPTTGKLPPPTHTHTHTYMYTHMHNS